MKYDGTPIEARTTEEIRKIRSSRKAKMKRCGKRIEALQYETQLAYEAAQRCDRELEKRKRADG